MVEKNIGMKLNSPLRSEYGIAILCLLFVLACSTNNPDKIQEQEVKKPTPEQVLKKFTAYGTKEGKKIWYLTADKAYLYESKNVALLEKFNVKFYKTSKTTNLPTGEVSSVIKSNRGELDINKNDFRTIGKTTVTTFDNEILECEDLRYVDREKKIFTDSSVVITRSDSIVKGKGLEATPDLSVVIVKHNRVDIKK